MADMSDAAAELRFIATPEKGEVSALLVRPAGATHLLVLGHGASTNMRHANLEAIATGLADAGIATFRYNFPYAEHGKGRRRPGGLHGDGPLGHRRGTPGSGRPAGAGGGLFLQREDDFHRGVGGPARGRARLVFFSFPLHQPGKPETKRAEHLAAVTVPMLFLSGTRDELAAMDLLRPICSGSANAPRSTPSTRPTTATRSSSALAPAGRTSSPRWHASSSPGHRGWSDDRSTPPEKS